MGEWFLDKGRAEIVRPRAVERDESGQITEGASGCPPTPRRISIDGTEVGKKFLLGEKWCTPIGGPFRLSREGAGGLPGVLIAGGPLFPSP